MLITGIKSRPVYRALTPDLTGRYHVLAAQGSGGAAALRFLDGMPTGDAVRVVYARESISGNDFSPLLAERGLVDLRIVSTQAEALEALHKTLAGCVMGTRLYLAGSESFLGSALQVAMDFYPNADEIQRELCGNEARRVHCIHCRTANENVSTPSVKCIGCGRRLIVRDHYSRRLGAYMGVMDIGPEVADAATSGADVPGAAARGDDAGDSSSIEEVRG